MPRILLSLPFLLLLLAPVANADRDDDADSATNEAGVSPRCEAAMDRAAGNYSRCLLGAQARNARRPNASRLERAEQHCADRFDRATDRAHARAEHRKETCTPFLPEIADRTVRYAESVATEASGKQLRTKFSIKISTYLETEITQENVEEIIIENINLSTLKSKYVTEYIDAKVIYDSQNNSQAILVFLNARHTYNVRVERIDLDEQNEALTVSSNYALSDFDVEQLDQFLELTKPDCPDESIEFVAATPIYPGSPYSPADYIEFVLFQAQEYGYKTVKLLGEQATVQNYLDYLSCPNLKGFFNVSHGIDGELIVLADQYLTYISILKKFLSSSLALKVVVEFNSCEIAIDGGEFKAAMISPAQAQKFAGGTTDLVIGASEPVSFCFWVCAFAGKSLTESLAECNNDPDAQGTFGISGNGDDFLRKASNPPSELPVIPPGIACFLDE